MDILQTLKFYSDPRDLLKNKRGYVRGTYATIMLQDRLPSFQIERDTALATVATFDITPIDGGGGEDMFDYIDANDLKVIPFPSKDRIIYFSNAPFPEEYLEPGVYELTIVSDGVTYTSDAVKVIPVRETQLDGTQTTCDYIKVEYWAECLTAGIFYDTVLYGHPVYKSILFLETTLARPEYDYQEEGDEDPEKRFDADTKTLEKQKVAKTIAPERAVDAIAAIQLAKYVTLQENGVDLGDVIQTVVEPPEWGESWLYAELSINFIMFLETVSGCCNSTFTPITDCIAASRAVTANIVKDSDDWTNFTYEHAGDGSLVTFGGAHFMLVYDPADTYYHMYAINTVDPSYILMNASNFTRGEVVEDLNEKNNQTTPDLDAVYWYWDDTNERFFNKPVVESITPEVVQASGLPFRVAGMVYDSCILDVYAKLFNGGVVYLGEYSATEFNGAGIIVDTPFNTHDIKVVAKGVTGCEISHSIYYDVGNEPPEGISVMEINTDFEVGN